MTKYESIPPVLEADEEAPMPCQEGGQHRSKFSLCVVIGGVVSMLSMLLVLLAVRSSTGASTTDAAAAVPTLGIAKRNSAKGDHPTPCTFKECYASNCNQKVAPFTCLFHNGGPHGGCSPIPWVEGSCTKQCDLSHCADLDIPDDAESCDRPCDKTVCTGARLCGHDAPYQCTSGSAAFGCSEGKLEWTLRTSSNTCSSCCNAKSCK